MLPCLGRLFLRGYRESVYVDWIGNSPESFLWNQKPSFIQTIPQARTISPRDFSSSAINKTSLEVAGINEMGTGNSLRLMRYYRPIIFNNQEGILN